MASFGDAKCPASTQYPHGLAFDDGDFVLVGPVVGDNLTLRLGHDFAGHDHQVVVGKSSRPRL